MIASASCLVMIRLWRLFEVGKRWPSVGRSWTSTNPFGRYHWCHNIHLLLRPLVFILTIAFVLLRLYLLLLPRPFINKESVERMVNQLVFVCHASTGMKTTHLIELGFWRRSTMAWGRARRGGRGLGSGAVRSFCTDAVVQWLAREARRSMRMYGV